MITPELLHYIRQQIASGKTQGEINQILIGQGWKLTDIQEAMGSLNSATSTYAPNVVTNTPNALPQKSSTFVRVVTWFVSISLVLGLIVMLIAMFLSYKFYGSVFKFTKSFKDFSALSDSIPQSEYENNESFDPDVFQGDTNRGVAEKSADSLFNVLTEGGNFIGIEKVHISLSGVNEYSNEHPDSEFDVRISNIGNSHTLIPEGSSYATIIVLDSPDISQEEFDMMSEFQDSNELFNHHLLFDTKEQGTALEYLKKCMYAEGFNTSNKWFACDGTTQYARIYDDSDRNVIDIEFRFIGNLDFQIMNYEYAIESFSFAKDTNLVLSRKSLVSETIRDLSPNKTFEELATTIPDAIYYIFKYEYQ